MCSLYRVQEPCCEAALADPKFLYRQVVAQVALWLNRLPNPASTFHPHRFKQSAMPIPKRGEKCI